MSSPTARTLAYFKKLGCIVCVVEKWNQFSKKRHDAFQIIDILAICSLENTTSPSKSPSTRSSLLGIQATSGSNHAARIEKALNTDTLRPWLRTGNRFMVVSWSKKGARGKRKLWTPRVSEFFLVNGMIKIEEDL